jgi:alkyl hydroperoxide reductase subunit AhpC
MITATGTAAPRISGDAFVRGEKRREISLDDYRGTWVVLAFGVRHADVLELARLEEALAADGAVVIAATPDDWHEVAHRYGDEATVRFPILAGIEERRRITAVVDPGGVVRHVVLRRSARETLAQLESQLYFSIAAPALAA